MEGGQAVTLTLSRNMLGREVINGDIFSLAHEKGRNFTPSITTVGDCCMATPVPAGAEGVVSDFRVSSEPVWLGSI